jgi:hypothetical protein
MSSTLKEQLAEKLRAKMLVGRARANIQSPGSIVSDGVFVSPAARQHAEQVLTIGQDRTRQMDVKHDQSNNGRKVVVGAIRHGDTSHDLDKHGLAVIAWALQKFATEEIAIEAIHRASRNKRAQSERHKARKAEEYEKAQQMVVDAMETHWRGKETGIGMAVKSIAEASFQKYDAIVKLLCFEVDLSTEKWTMKTLESENPKCAPGVRFPQMFSERTVRRQMKKYFAKQNVTILEADGSSIAIGTVDTAIVEGIKKKGKKRALQEVTEVELQWDAHGGFKKKKITNRLLKVRMHLP